MVSLTSSETENLIETFVCIMELVPVVATFAKNPAEGAAGFLVWAARCLPKIGSPPSVGGRRRRRVLRVAYDFVGADWVVHTSGKISQ
jgi:hypothetical protein